MPSGDVIGSGVSDAAGLGAAARSSLNRNRPLRGWPSAATIRHSTEYRPPTSSSTRSTATLVWSPETYSVSPVSTRVLSGPSTSIPPKASSTGSLNRITTRPGASPWTLSDFGSVDRTKLCALTEPAHSRPATLAVARTM
jgi:hypothetical protein